MDTTAAVALAGSAFSTLCTAYFWLVRVRGERPHLRAFVIDREFFLGLSHEQSRQIGFKAGVVVANGSTLPNALIGARAGLRTREGNWIDVTTLSFDKQTPLPVNLPSMQTALLRLQGTLTFPYSAANEQGGKTVLAYLQQHLVEPWQIRLELHSLNDRRDSFDIQLPPPAA